MSVMHHRKAYMYINFQQNRVDRSINYSDIKPDDTNIIHTNGLKIPVL